jgi:formamidopyrimidine-DNA glycosylase
MPELPEVELVRQYLEEHVRGRRISMVAVADEGILENIAPRRLQAHLRGKVFETVRRHGKQLFLELAGGGCMTMHLGMTGEATFYQQERAPFKHDRLSVRFEDDGLLVYNDSRKFGAISWAKSMQAFIALKHLGPDALQISKPDFIDKVGSHRKAIKTTLLDQHVVAGIGNLYSDEILFQVKVHPLVEASSLSSMDLGKMHQMTRTVLHRSIKVRTAFSLLPRGYILRDRSLDAACPRHNGRLRPIVVNGRTAFICPGCQASPS